MINTICEWLNDRDLTRLAIALIGGPGSSFFMTRSSGWVEIIIGMILLISTTLLALVYGRWVFAQESQ